MFLKHRCRSEWTRMIKSMSQHEQPMVDEASDISMLSSINHKRFCTSSRDRHVQVCIDIIKVTATILVIPEYEQFKKILSVKEKCKASENGQENLQHKLRYENSQHRHKFARGTALDLKSKSTVPAS